MLASRFPALTYRNFRIFFAGQFFSLIGTWMQATTTPYLAYRLTDMPIYLGLVGFAQSLPTLLLALPGGVWVERLDKRKAVIALQAVMMLQAFVLAYLALTRQITIWHIIAMSFVLGSANAIEITARQSMLIELVDKASLPNAIALNATIFNAARVLGPSLAAPFLILLPEQGEGWAFFANGVSYLFVLVGLFFINTHSVIPERPANASLLQDFMAGQRYIRQDRLIFLLISLAALPGFFAFPLLQQVPVFAREVLGTALDTAADVATRNSLMLTFMGIGALVAAVFLASFSSYPRKGRLLAIGQIVFALAIIGLALSRTVSLAYPLMVLLGWGQITQLANNNTLIQVTVPDEFRGRVFSTYLFALQGITPFGNLFLGWLVQTSGPTNALLFSGLFCLVVFSAVHLSTPIIRRQLA